MKERRGNRAGPWMAILSFSILLGGLPGPSRAGLIASDSYTIGSNLLAGQYQAGTALKNQPTNLTNPGFANGPYGPYGTGTTTTSNFVASSGGLSYPPLGTPPADDGKVSWLGANADGTLRAVGRSIATPVPSSGTYWFNILVSQDGTTASSTNGYVLAGFGNTIPPIAGSTAGNNEGLYFGFSQNGTANDSGNLVIRYRSGASTDSDAILVDGSTTSTANVYNIVARLDVNYGGGSTDYLTYWVDPTDYSSQQALDATSIVTNDTSAGPTGSLATLALQSATDFQRLSYSARNWTGRANFDEVRLGTNLSDIAPAVSVPEPASVGLLALGLTGGLALGFRRRASR